MKAKTIIYVDDDTSLAEGAGILIKMHFRAKGIHTHIFTDEAQVDEYLGSAAMNSETPVLAIVDLWMIDKRTMQQNMEAGFVVIDKLRSRFKSIPIMVVSAHIDEAALQRLKPLKQSAVIDKTITPRELIDNIEKVLAASDIL